MALTLETRQNNKNTAGTSVSAVSGNNNGGLLGGSLYLNEKMALGFLSSVEGIWDYTAGGIAKLFGADKWAERQFANDLVNYNHADEWYDPGKGWQFAGDVAGGIGTSLPAIVAAGVAAKLTVATGGAAAPAAVKLLSLSVAPLVSGLGAAGNATKSAYQKTGELGLKEFGYGAISGATEAAVEGLTARIGTGTGRIVSSLSKRAAGETVSTLGKSGAFSLLKTLGADFASEAVEEGLSEALDPLYQRWTSVDPNAQNASAKEIGYAALVGGLSGVVMSGGAAAFNTTANLFGGERSVNNGTSGDIINTARQIAEYESANDTGYKSFQAIRDAYSQLSASLSSTGGQVSTVRQKMLLGSLKKAETAAFFEPFIERSAMKLLTDADSAAARFSALGMTDASGKALSFTADQIRSGVDASLLAKMQSGTLSGADRKTLTRQLRAAIGTNSVLTSLAVMDATGRISMDTEKFAQAALSGRLIADAADLNRFIETASPAQIENLSKKLKIDNWAALTPDVFQSRVAEFNATEEGQAYRAQMEFVKQAQSIADSESKKLPRLFRSNTVAQGLTHYASADGRVNMALLRDGDRYHLYDYETGNPSRDLTLAEVNSAIRPYWNAQGNTQSTAQAAQDAQKPMEVQTQAQAQESATESATAAQAVRLNMIASENISDWKQLSEPNRAAVRMTMRQAIAAGLDEDTALTFGRVSARSGMNIVFSAEQSGEGDARISGNTIYIDPNADKGRMENKLLLHEAGHALMRERDGARLIARAFETVAPDRSSKIAQKYQKFYQQRGMSMDQYLPIVDEEIATAGIEDTLGDINAWEYILSEEPSFGNKILNFFRKSAQDYSSSAGLSREARKLLNTYKKMFAELSERNRGNNAITLANEAKMSGEIDDARFSLKYADTIAYNQRITAQNRSFITMEELNKAIADTDRMVGVMKPHEKILPKDKEGKTLVKNGSYDVSVENTTVCIRTLSYNAFVDMVSEKIHRPLSQMESFLVSQKLYDIAKEPQCLYCYVSLDRKAYNEMLLRYLKQRDDAIAAYEAAGRPKITRSSELYEKFRNTPTKRKDTDEMWDRYRSWIDAVNRGEHLLTADEIATETRREELAKKGGSEAAQVKDMLKYAQSASWAKKQTQYAAYFGDILRLSPRVVNNLNRHYGLRWYSFSDYSGAFIVENMQQITDASIRGLKGLSYTKDTDFAEIFAPTGMNINISVYAKRVGDHYEIDAKQSADLEKAIDLRKKYPNVGIVVVATDQEGVEWALKQEWSDVVIPFHTVRTGAQVAEFYDWTVFNEEQNDSVKDENLWKAYVDDVAAGKSDPAKKKVSKMVYPSEHQNNREKYLKLIEERGLKPRFSSFLDNPNYMKLVNETRQSEAQTSPLKPIYDVKAAEESFAKFVEKGGYYEGWYNDGIDVDAEAEIVAQDIRAGKKANEVEYGRQDVDYEQIAKGRKSQRAHGERFALPEDSKYLDAVNRGDIETAQRMVDEAAKKAGYDTDAYHGTNQGSFTVFDWSKTQRADGGFYGRGHYFTKSENMAKMYGERIIRGKLKLGKTFVWSEQVNSYENKKPPELLSRNVVSRINLAKIFPDIFASQKMHYWEYDATKGENVEKTIKWGDLEGIVKDLSNGLVLRAYADGTYRWHTEGRFWEVPVGESFSSKEDAEGGKFFAAINALPEKYDGLLQNMSFDDQTTYTQQYGTEITEALKKSGYESAIDTPEGGEIVVFGSSQIKSADPVTYDDNGNVIPLSDRFNADNNDIRYALPEDGEKKKKYHMSAGQLRADVANKTRKKAYSKADARATLEGFTGADLLTKKAQNELADYLWQGFNTCETPEQRQKFARGFSTEFAEKLFELDGPFDKMRGNEREAMALGFERQIMQAFEERGHLSVFQKRVGYLFEQYSQMAEDAQAKYDEVVGRDKILGRIDSLAQKMKDLKMGTFANATQMDSDIFVGTIHKLANIEYRRNLSVTKAKNALRELAAWYTQEQKPLMYVDDQNPGYYNKGVAEMLRALTETDEPFTKDQLSVLQDVMSYFVKFVENYGKIWRGNKWIDAKTEAERYVAQIQENEKLGKNTFDRMMAMRYQVNFGDPHSVVKSKDMYADGFFTEMYEDIRQATLDADVKLMEVLNDYDKFMADHKRYMRDAAKQDIRWVEEERTNTMPKMMAIGLYMTSKREHAQAGLALNGFKFKDRDGNIIKAGALIRNADPKEVTQAQILEAISELQSRIRKQLSAEDLEYIKILEKGYGQDLRSLKAERDIQRQGFTNVTTGYYYPIRRADIAKSIDVSAFSELDRVSNASFNKSIVEGARGNLFIEDADALFHRHANAVTRYWALQPVIESFNILYNMDVSGNPNNSVSVATTSENQWKGSKEYFRDLIADIQGVPKNTGEFSKELANVRSHVAMSQLGANPKTWVTQFSSLFAASSMLDPTSITKGLAHVSNDVDAYCDLAKLRNYESAAIKAQGVLDKVSSVGEALMKPIAWTDRLVVKILWGACQVQVQRDSKLKIGTEENKLAAGKLLTEVLFETQQNSLATERSAMMRSGNELIRALTMFSADGMKVTGRFLDGIGEVSALKRRLETVSAEERPALEKKLKSARKKSRRATAAMVSSAVFAVAIAECFRWLYAKEREEDENAVLDMTLDFVGNLLGGLPGLRDVYTFFVDGYELDNYAISAVNDLLTSVKSSFSLAYDIVRGEGDTSEIPAKVKNLSYAVSQFFGLPVRNVYNVLSGLTRRVAPQAGYKLDSVFYKKNYRTDLKKAVEEGDARRVSLLMGLINGKDITGQIGEDGMSELSRLAASGASVLPRTIRKTVSINGEEVELDTSQVQMINEAYSESWSSSMASLLASSAYASMSDEKKEKVIRAVHDISYERALLSVGIDRGEKSVLIADLIGIESAAVYYSLTSGIVSDVDKNGKAVEGSRRAKVVSAIRSMNLGREKTLLMICLAGYSLKDGDVRGMKAKSEKVLLLKYIMQLPGKSAAQKAVIAQACGFEVRNGRVLMSSLNGD